MKTLLSATIAFLLMLPVEVAAQVDSLNVFLEKFERYAQTHNPKLKRNMPIATPGANSVAFPEPRFLQQGYMEDPETGLRYYAREGKIFDPLTAYYIDYYPEAVYWVDHKAGKIMKADEAVEVKKKIKHN